MAIKVASSPGRMGASFTRCDSSEYCVVFSPAPADSCVGCAVHSTLPAGKGYTTVELKINYVRAVTDKLALVRAEGKVIHVGGRLATAEGRLTGPDGKLYAHASTTCFVFETPLTERH